MSAIESWFEKSSDIYDELVHQILHSRKCQILNIRGREILGEGEGAGFHRQLIERSRKGLHAQLLLQNSHSASIAKRARAIGKPPHVYAMTMDAARGHIEEFVSRHSLNLELRLYIQNPVFALWIFDECLFVSFYVDSVSRQNTECYKVIHNSAFYEALCQHFDSVWEQQSSPTQDIHEHFEVEKKFIISQDDVSEVIQKLKKHSTNRKPITELFNDIYFTTAGGGEHFESTGQELRLRHDENSGKLFKTEKRPFLKDDNSSKSETEVFVGPGYLLKDIYKQIISSGYKEYVRFTKDVKTYEISLRLPTYGPKPFRASLVNLILGEQFKSTEEKVFLEIETILHSVPTAAQLEEIYHAMRLFIKDCNAVRFHEEPRTYTSQVFELLHPNDVDKWSGSRTGRLKLVDATVGIVTALPKEFSAVTSVLECAQRVAPEDKSGMQYALGTVTTKFGEEITIAVTLMNDMGSNMATFHATKLREHFPKIELMIMCGIAGAVPNPAKASDHVRLGDIVVSNKGGVIQYDFDKESLIKVEHRHAPRPPSAAIIQTIKHLQAEQLKGNRPWIDTIGQAIKQLGALWDRPPNDMDVLLESIDGYDVVHPTDVERVVGEPKLFEGPIASANKLLKNPVKRDFLRDNFGVKAVEMEGSGIADAAWNLEINFFIVRGTCDYCDQAKGDHWQNYAALIAACFTKVVLENSNI